MLARVPGLQKRFVYYLEAQGYIRPHKVRKQRISRRDYSPEDLRIIREVWRYYQRGYSVQSAYQLATRRQRATVYLAFTVPRHRWEALLQALQGFSEVEEAAGLYGGTGLDFLVRATTPEEGDLYYTLIPLLVGQVEGVPAIIRVVRSVHINQGEGELLAYVMMRVPGKDVDRVLEALKQFPGVVEASTVYGETDIIAKVQVPDQEELDNLVMEKIHGIPGVESTRTFIVVRRYAWSRS